MKDQFVTYEIAKELKELGFDEYCIGEYTKHAMSGAISLRYPKYEGLQDDYPEEHELIAPLWQQAIDWLRKEGVFIVGPFPITETYEIQDKYGKTIYMSIPTLEWAVKDSIKLINERLH